MIRPELLKILCCPETHQALRIADAVTVEKLNAAISKGTLKNKIGQVVADKIDGALVREDNALAYVIRQQIPVLLVDEGVPLVEVS